MIMLDVMYVKKKKKKYCYTLIKIFNVSTMKLICVKLRKQKPKND